MTEEATITVQIVRRSELEETNTSPVTRRLGIAEIIMAPVRRAMAMDFFSYFK